ncbi:dienelactone hydrolase family protein [soil metagenome]
MSTVTLQTSKAEIFEGPESAPAVIVVHEWWGLNDDIRSLSARFVSEGFTALAVDLFAGKLAKNEAEAGELANEMKTTDAMTVITDAVKYLRGYGAPKVGITGFCLGGGMALAAGCTVAGLSAAVPFYGIPKPEFLRFSRDTPPILGHYSKIDAWASLERANGIAAQATAAGASFVVEAYDGPHAFMRAHDPKAYHEASATLAWKRTVEFLKKSLG